MTHVQAIVGRARGDFDRATGEHVAWSAFNAGPSAIEALLADAVDLTYVGPNPATNGYLRSQGKALRVIAGATLGGAGLVVRPAAGIRTARDLAGKRIGSPQLGNTQDVALRHFLRANGLDSTERGGTVRILPIANPDQLALMQRGEIDGAWAPEPWLSRLVREAGGVLWLDERTLWPNGRFVTVLLVARTEFLRDHPDRVRRFLRGHVEVTRWINDHREEAARVVSEEIGRETGRGLPLPIVQDAFGRIEVTTDPARGTLEEAARHARALGLLPPGDDHFANLYDLSLLEGIQHEAAAARDP